eukprot:3248781-Pyramimonas_sp.AAC.1
MQSVAFGCNQWNSQSEAANSPSQGSILISMQSVELTIRGGEFNVTGKHPDVGAVSSIWMQSVAFGCSHRMQLSND